MSSSITLKGMTWSHPRGYDPLIRCSALWRDQTGIGIAWDKRSLQDFESFPVEDLARQYDLIIIDHPHVGQVTAEACLAPLDCPAALASASVGRSFESYFWAGQQWALPIDAAAQVQAWRPDRLARPLESWSEVVRLAADGKVAMPLRPPHSLMVFFSLSANRGFPCQVEGGELVDPKIGVEVLERMAELVGLIDPQCYEMDPIAVLEEMSRRDSPWLCSPLIYGYISYALAEFRPGRLAFADIPAAGPHGPVGSALGGTGIAVSSRSRYRKEAADFAYWVTSADIQKGPYAAAGGQPAHSAAWEDTGLNEAVLNFYRATRATLDGAWVRPRFNGYMNFQHEASQRIVSALQRGEPASTVINDLNGMFAKVAIS